MAESFFCWRDVFLGSAPSHAMQEVACRGADDDDDDDDDDLAEPLIKQEHAQGNCMSKNVGTSNSLRCSLCASCFHPRHPMPMKTHHHHPHLH
jgi:hypothetical protein